MTVLEALYLELTTDTGLTALTGTRIYAANRPELCAYPSLEYSIISENHEEALNCVPGWCSYSFQVDCYARTYTSSRAVAEQIRNVVQGRTGMFGQSGSPLTGGISVGIFGWQARDLGTEVLGDGSLLYRTICEFTIGAAETQPI